MIGNFPDTELAYVAGIIDGEGCIDFSVMYGRCVARVRGQRRGELIGWLLSRFGGRTRTSMGSRGGGRQSHWALAGNNAVELLKAVRPYLVLKGDQADLAIQAHNTRDRSVVQRLTVMK